MCVCVSPAVEFLPAGARALASSQPVAPTESVTCGGPISEGTQTVFTPDQAAQAKPETLGAKRSVGMRFTTAAQGNVTAIRFFKPLFSEAGVAHTGFIFDDVTGTRLATTEAFDDVGCGDETWVRVALATPLRIEPDRVYIVAIDNVTYYAATPEFFLMQPAVRGDLTALRHGSVAGPAGQMPKDNFRDKCYWVDVEFSRT